MTLWRLVKHVDDVPIKLPNKELRLLFMHTHRAGSIYFLPATTVHTVTNPTLGQRVLTLVVQGKCKTARWTVWTMTWTTRGPRTTSRRGTFTPPLVQKRAASLEVSCATTTRGESGPTLTEQSFAYKQVATTKVASHRACTYCRSVSV
jgi:hypothetical protein